MPQYNIVLHTAYDDLFPVESWSREADYLRARDFLRSLVGGPHGTSKGRYAGAEVYKVATRAQADQFRKFKEQLRQANPESDRYAALAQTKLHVHCLFDGMSMSLPYDTVQNYRLASALASELTGPAGRTISDDGETFYLETREQLDALFDLQRKLKARGLIATR